MSEENTYNSDGCAGDCPDSAIGPAFVEHVYDDFDEQSEQLTGHDQEYFQISSGAFRGRFVSAFPGAGVSLHMETSNQALEQRIGCPRGTISLGLVIGPKDRFESNGIGLTAQQVQMAQPGCELHMKSPAGGTVLAVCFDRGKLLGCFDEHDAPKLLRANNRQVDVVDAPLLAQQLRANALGVLDSMRHSDPDEAGVDLAQPLMSATSAQFALHEAIMEGHRDEVVSDTSRTYNRARRFMLESSGDDVDYAELCAVLGRSKRSIQLAFSRHANMSPTGYFRAIRLSRVRRALTSDENRRLSIGDVAAFHGFWSWSQFSQAYKRQFGELPSDTRARAN